MRVLFKRLIFGVFVLLNLIPLIIYFLLKVIFRSDRIFADFSQMYSLIPGKIGDYCRSSFYFFTLKRCSADVTISLGTIFPTPDVEIGSFVYIGAYCNISNSVIGDDVMLGSNVNAIGAKMTHNFDDIETPIRLQGGQATTVLIGRNTWVGNSTIIMADLGAGCVIGAGSVVTKNIDDYSVAVGNPAKVIKKRA